MAYFLDRVMTVFKLRELVTGVVFGLVCWSVAPTLQGADRPNVVLIYADDLGLATWDVTVRRLSRRPT